MTAAADRYTLAGLLLTDMKDNADLLTFMSRRGHDLNVLRNRDGWQDTLPAVLRDNEVSASHVQSLLMAERRDDSSRAIDTVSIVEEFLREGTPARVQELGGAIVVSMTTVLPLCGKDEALLARIWGIGDALTDRASEQRMEQCVALFELIAGTSSDKRYVDDLFTIVESYARECDESGVGTIAEKFEHARTSTDGPRDGHWIQRAMRTVLTIDRTPERMDAVFGSYMRPLINADAWVCDFDVDGETGSYIIRYGDANGWSHALLYSLFNRYCRNKERLIAVATYLLSAGTADADATARAFIYLLNNDTSTAAAHLDVFERLLTVDRRHITKETLRNLVNKAVSSNILAFAPIIIEHYQDSGVQAQAFGMFGYGNVKRAREQYPRAELEALCLKVWNLSDGWDVKTVHPARSSLINSQLLPADVMRSIADGANTAEAELAQKVLGEYESRKAAAAAEAAANSSWDGFVQRDTTFAQFAAAAATQGTKGIAALGMYATDPRVSLDSRRGARDDLMRFLSTYPQYLSDVPESVWVALNRVRETLTVEPGLALALHEMGGAAQRFASKHMVRTVLL